MKKFILSLAVVALAWGCTTDGTEDVKQLAGDKTVIEAELASVRTHIAEDGFKVLWSKGDKIGVVLADDSIVPFTLQDAYAGKAVGCFEGNLAAGAEVKSAIYPYSASGVTIAREQSVASTSTEISSGDVAVATYENGKLNFTSKVALLAVSFKNIDGSMIAGKKIQTVKVATSACNVSGAFTLADDGALTAGKVSQNVNLTFTDAPTLSADLKGYLALNPAIVKDTALRIYVKAGDKWYGYDTVAKADMVAGTRYNFVIDAAKCNYRLALNWAYGKAGDIPYRSTGHVPAIDNNGNVYVTNASSQYLYKINNGGTLGWKSSLCAVGGTATAYTQNTSPSVEPDGSAVYASIGAKNDITAFSKLNSNGTIVWQYKQADFYATGTPSIGFNRSAPAIDPEGKCVYLCNAGTTGTLTSIDKATGKKLNYTVQGTGHNSGPNGGQSGSPMITLSGAVCSATNGNTGLYAVLKSDLDVQSEDRFLEVANHSNSGYWAMMRYQARYNNANQEKPANDRSCLACTTLSDGRNMIYLGNAMATTTTTYRVFGFDVADIKSSNGNTVVNKATACDVHLITGQKAQDQAGICIGPNNEILVALKNNGKAGAYGGIYAINPETMQKAWNYETYADVAGAPAVGSDGSIVLVTDSTTSDGKNTPHGQYHVIKPNSNGTVSLVATVNAHDLLRDFNWEGHDTYKSLRGWSDVMIGTDGRIYYQHEAYRADNNVQNTCVLCVEYGGFTAPGNTAWPMRYADCHHTGVQKSVK